MFKAPARVDPRSEVFGLVEFPIFPCYRPRVASQSNPSPHFSQAFYCGVGYGHVYGVALGRAPRHTVKIDIRGAVWYIPPLMHGLLD